MDEIMYVPLNRIVITFIHGYCVAIDQYDNAQTAKKCAALLNS